MEEKLEGKVIIKGKISCLTGLRIGGNAENFEIGGMDNPIIREPINGHPYIPGSSLKGKMRSLLEWSLRKFSEKGGACDCGKADCKPCRIFGTSADKSSQPTRLFVRDAFFTNEAIQLLKKNEDTLIKFAEWKKENTINRLEVSANPRDLERVPAGMDFNFEFVYTVYNHDEAVEDLVTVSETMKLLEDDYLGASGSRGYGKMRFGSIIVDYRDMGYYRSEKETGNLAKYETVSEMNRESFKKLLQTRS